MCVFEKQALTSKYVTCSRLKLMSYTGKGFATGEAQLLTPPHFRFVHAS